jgi:two-component system sensor histidine kinase KdpD
MLAASTRSSSGWLWGLARPAGCFKKGIRSSPRGRDVAIELPETLGRAATAAIAEGLELIPRIRVLFRGTVLKEMDLSRILRRAPGTSTSCVRSRSASG